MKFTTEEKITVYRIASWCGLLLCGYLFALMVLIDEAKWASDGWIFMLLGVLGYFSLIFLGILTFLKVEVKRPDGSLRRVTVWEVLGYSLFGVVMSRFWQHIEQRIGISESVLTIVAIGILLIIGLLLYLKSRKIKVS